MLSSLGFYYSKQCQDKLYTFVAECKMKMWRPFLKNREESATKNALMCDSTELSQAQGPSDDGVQWDSTVLLPAAGPLLGLPPRPLLFFLSFFLACSHLHVYPWSSDGHLRSNRS